MPPPRRHTFRAVLGEHLLSYSSVNCFEQVVVLDRVLPSAFIHFAYSSDSAFRPSLIDAPKISRTSALRTARSLRVSLVIFVAACSAVANVDLHAPDQGAGSRYPELVPLS